jgi:hypothetical protein
MKRKAIDEQQGFKRKKREQTNYSSLKWLFLCQKSLQNLWLGNRGGSSSFPFYLVFVYFLLIFLGRLVVGCWFWMTGVSVDRVVVRSRLSGVGCRVVTFDCSMSLSVVPVWRRVSVVECSLFWLTVVSVDRSCQFLVVGCRLSSAHCFDWQVYLSMVVDSSWLSGVECSLFWLTGVSVDGSCQFLFVGCRLSSADCFL